MDYEIGFARLADPEDLTRSSGLEAEFRFNEDSRYGAIIPGSNQVAAIKEYEKKTKLPVYYQLYNPWTSLFVQRVPLSQYATPSGPLDLGVRIVPAKVVHSMLRGREKAYRPSLRELGARAEVPKKYGWPLDHFIAQEFLDCREGGRFNTINDDAIQSLFYRRTGAIAAAIAITIEAPSAA